MESHNLGDVAEQRDLRFSSEGMCGRFCTQDVRLNSGVSISFTLCWVGLVFCSPGSRQIRPASRAQTKYFPRPSSPAHLPDALPEMQRLDVATVPPIPRSPHPRRRNFLDDRFDFAVTCGITCTVAVVSARFWSNCFVNSAGRPVIVRRQLRVREPFIVPQVHRSPRRLGHKHFA